MNKMMTFFCKTLLRFCIYFTISICVFYISLRLNQHIFFLKILFSFVDLSILPLIFAIIAIGSLFIAVCVELICSGFFFSNIKYIWRIIILCLINTLVFAAIALIFNWFPLNNLQALGSFFLFVTIINIFWGGSIVIKTKLQDRKDNKLLKQYKKIKEDN